MVRKSAHYFSSFAIFHPFLYLSEDSRESFSSQEVSASAASFFESRGINATFVNEFIPAENRYRHARDLDQVNLLSSLLALRLSADVEICHGN